MMHSENFLIDLDNDSSESSEQNEDSDTSQNESFGRTPKQIYLNGSDIFPQENSKNSQSSPYFGHENRQNVSEEFCLNGKSRERNSIVES